MIFHHLGIIVDDMEKYVNIFKALGGKVVGYGTSDEFEAECTFIKFDEKDTLIELIKSTKDNNHLTRFIEKYGIGLHHIAFRGKGNKKGALPNMFVDFNKPDDNNRLLVEQVELK